MILDFKKASTYFNDNETTFKNFAIAYGIMAFCIIATIIYCVVLMMQQAPNTTPDKIISTIDYNFNFLNLFLNLSIIVLFGGYYALNTNLRLIKSGNTIAQWSNLSNIFTAGIKYMFGIGILLTINTIIFALISSFMLGFIEGFCSALDKNTVTAGIILSIIAIIISIAIALLMIYITTIFSLSFCTNLKFKSFFNFKFIKILAIDNLEKSFSAIMQKTLLDFAFILIYFIAFITLIGIFIMPVINFYYMLFSSDISSQIIKLVIPQEEKIEEEKEP